MDQYILKHGFDGRTKPGRAIAEAVSLLSNLLKAESTKSVSDIRSECTELLKGVPPEYYQKSKAIISIMVDICLQGWKCESSHQGEVILSRPPQTDPEYLRSSIQGGLLVQRDEQLRLDSVRDFVKEMESVQLTGKGWHSIYHLFCDGRDLVDRLKGSQPEVFNSKSISPYLQFVEQGSLCEFTGLKLMDIWRYFRLTWSIEYKTVPGRNLAFLVRDAAGKNHPIIGILAFASPVMNLSDRDAWIGWTSEALLERVKKNPCAKWGHWLIDGINKLINETYFEDFLDEGLLTKKEISRPNEDVIERLEGASRVYKQKHDRHPQKALLGAPDPAKIDAVDWLSRARSHLYSSKRCVALSDALRMRLAIRNSGMVKPTVTSVRHLISTKEGERAFDILRKYQKAVHAGNDVLDITVCGAVAPYNNLLGGKLVAMMATSPMVSCEYVARYSGRPSIIASSMAGRPIYRDIRLPLLTTTSLYGVEPNQYTRISVDGTSRKYSGKIRFEKIGKTAGNGTFQYSSETTRDIDALLRQSGGAKVNSIFGEGQSPRLRKIRMGLDACGFPASELLSHGNPRIIYGIPLAKNFRDLILEYDKRVQYFHDQAKAELANEEIARQWWLRWAAKKITVPESIERISCDNLVYPIRHRARVVLPRVRSAQEEIFDEVDGA